MKLNSSTQIFLLLVILSIAVFSPSLMNLNSFWDDEKYIFSNPYFLLAPSAFSFFKINSPFYKSWSLGYAIIWTILKIVPNLNILFFKLLNIFIHAINAFLFFKILQRFKTNFAMIFAILFLVHPQNVETVSWFFQFFTLFATTFALISVWLFINYSETDKIKYFFTSILCFIASLFIKPIAIFLPFLALFLKFPQKEMRMKKVIFISICLLFSLALGLLTKNGNFVMLENSNVKLTGISEKTKINRELFYSKPSDEIINSSNTLVESYHNIDQKKSGLSNTSLDFDSFSIFKQAFFYYNTKLIYPFPLLFNFPKLNTSIFELFLGLIIFLIIPIFIFFRTKIFSKALFYPASFLIIMAPYLGFQYIPYFYWSNVSDRYAYLLILIFPIFLGFLLQALNITGKKAFNFTWGVILFFAILSFQYGALFNSPLKLYSKIKIENPKPEIYALLYEEQLKNNLYEDAKATITEAKLKYPTNSSIIELIQRHEILKNNYQN